MVMVKPLAGFPEHFFDIVLLKISYYYSNSNKINKFSDVALDFICYNK